MSEDSKNEVIVNESVKRVERLVANEYTARAEYLKKLSDPRRSINDECGYPDTAGLDVNEYSEMYAREGIATRVVDILPDESWMVHPKVLESEDNEEETEFEKAWGELGQKVSGVSWYSDETEKSSPIWEYLHRIDRLSGVGSYGIILLGFSDKKDLLEPVEPTKGLELLYVKTFAQANVRISSYEPDKTNPRYGRPKTYSVDFTEQTNNSGEIGTVLSTIDVHWSRVIHVADNVASNEDFGVPRQQPVWNRLQDLRKLYSGSGEMYWRGAFPGLSFESHPSVDPDDIQTEGLKDAMEQYMNTLQRYMISSGMTVKSLAPQVVSPNEQIEVQIDAICIRFGIPKRIFMGSERGELASSQDSKTWNKRIAFRQNNYITPRLIVPFIDRLIMVGVLPEPKSFQVVWPDMNSLTLEEQADISSKRTEAMAKFVAGGVGDELMTQQDFLTRELGYTSEESQEILGNLLEFISDKPDSEEDEDGE